MSCPLTVIFVLRVLQSAPSGTISLNSAFSEATLPREDSDWTSQLNRKSQDAALDAVFVSPADAVRVSLFVSYLKADAGTQSHVRPCSGSRRRGRPPLQLMSENCANQRANGPKAPCSRTIYLETERFQIETFSLLRINAEAFLVLRRWSTLASSNWFC